MTRRPAVPSLAIILVLTLAVWGSADELQPAGKLFEQRVSAFQRGAFEEAASKLGQAASVYEQERQPGGRVTATI